MQQIVNGNNIHFYPAFVLQNFGPDTHRITYTQVSDQHMAAKA